MLKVWPPEVHRQVHGAAPAVQLVCMYVCVCVCVSLRVYKMLASNTLF